MKALKIILIVVIILVIGIIGIYAYYDGFTKVEVKEINEGGETFIYEEVKGDYAQTPDFTNKIYYTLLNEYKIETTKGAGLFFDNPQTIDKKDLRSEIGCLLDSDIDSTTTEKIKNQFKIKTLPKGKYVVAEFPFKGSMSIFTGMIKVYPALMKHLKDNQYKEGILTEIYDIQNKKTIYRIQISVEE